MCQLLLTSFAPLVIFAAVHTICMCVYLLVGINASTEFEVFVALGWGLLLLLWVDRDARHMRCSPSFDFGLYLLLFFPMSVLWYCFWSRGFRGWRALAALCGLWLSPHVVAVVLWIFLYARM